MKLIRLDHSSVRRLLGALALGTAICVPLVGCGDAAPEPKTPEEIEKARVEHGNQVLQEAQSSPDQ